MSGIKGINLLKLKGTYGLTGYVGPSANAALTIYAKRTIRPTTNDNETYLYIDDLKNEDLTWEKLKELNLGFELGLFNNRIYTEFNYYNRNSYDLIDYITTSGIGGVKTKLGNVGDMKSHGVEVTLKTKNVDAKNFKWETLFTFNYHKSEVKELQTFDRISDALDPTGHAMLGYADKGLWSIPFAGLDEYGVPMFYDNEGNVVNEVDLQNRTDIADWMVYEGPVTPKYQGGFINKFKYKNWSLSCNIVYKAGNKIRLND